MAQDGDPRSSPSSLSSIGLCLFDLFSKRDSTQVTDDCYQRPQRSVRSLIEENGEERLEHQHDDFKDKTPADRRCLQKRQRKFDGENEQRDDCVDDGNNRGLDDECYEDGSARSGLESSWVTQSASNKVPKELAVEQRKEAAPDGVGACGDANIARVFVPDKVSHRFRGLVVSFGKKRVVSTARVSRPFLVAEKGTLA